MGLDLAEEFFSEGRWAGSPRVIAHPGLPQIQTCRFPASGSSFHDFAALPSRVRTARARGSPYRRSKKVRGGGPRLARHLKGVVREDWASSGRGDCGPGLFRRPKPPSASGWPNRLNRLLSTLTRCLIWGRLMWFGVIFAASFTFNMIGTIEGILGDGHAGRSNEHSTQKSRKVISRWFPSVLTK